MRAVVVWGVAVLVASLTFVSGVQLTDAATVSRTGELGAPLDEPSVRDAMLAGERERVAERARERARSERVEERRASRTAYATLGDDAAVGLLRDRKTPLRTFGAFRADEVAAGTVQRFIGERAAQVRTDSGRRLVVASDVPMRTESREGEVAPVDLSVSAREGYFSVENAVVPVRFPRDLSDPVVLPDDGLAITVGSDREKAVGQAVGGTVVYPNARADVDVLLKAVPKGSEISWMVRSQRAPEGFRFSVAGRAVEDEVKVTQPEGVAGVVLSRGGKPEAFVLPPVAVDADGVTVPAAMRVDGSEVVVSLEHRERDVRYPVYLDPPIIDIRDWGGGNENFWGWQYGTNRPDWFSPFMATAAHGGFNGWGGGLYIGAYQYLAYNVGDLGQWFMGAPHESFIPRVDLVYARHAPDGTNFIGGIWAYRQQQWEPSLNSSYSGINPAAGPLVKSDAMYGGTVTSCAIAGCNPEYGHEGNMATKALQINHTHTLAQHAYAFAGAQHVYFNDRNDPFTAVMGGEMPSGWSNGTYWVASRLSDAGVGPWFNRLAHRTAGGSATVVDEDNGGAPCFGYLCADSVDTTVAAAADALPQGVGQLELTGFDWVSRQSNTVTWPVKVDTREPDVSVRGLPAAGVLDEDATLQINTDDGKPQDGATSGTQGLIVTIQDPGGQNAQVLHQDGAACGDNCAKSATVAVPYGAQATTHLEAANREIKVAAIDGATNPEIQTFPVRVAPGRLLTPAQGFKVPKLLALQADSARSGATGVRFEYRLAADGAWSAVPPAYVRNGTSTVSSWPVALDDGASPVLWWDAAGTPGITAAAGRVEVRGVITGAGGDMGLTRSAAGLLDASFMGSAYASADIGPGAVTLANGNYAFEEVDVNVEAAGSDLSVQRTYGSRRAGDPAGPLGPGWTLSTPVLSAQDSYLGVYRALDGQGQPQDEFVYAVLPDWSLIPFTSTGSDSFVSPPGYRDLRLSYAGDTDSYTITDSDGTATLFEKPAGSQGYKPTKVTLAGSSSRETRWTYITVGTQKVPEWAIAPDPEGVTCSPSSLPAGCWALKFTYAPSTTATGTSEANWGSYQHRLQKVELYASPNATGTPVATTVAEYLYDSNGHLRATWDPRISPALKERYAYTTGVLSEYTPPGERPWSFSYATTPSDSSPGRLSKVQRDALPSGTATWTLAYDVPVAGAGAPRQLAAGDVAAWGQADLPATATAVFPPTQVPASPPSSYSEATVYYLNANALAVNVARPGGRLSVTEYGHHRNAIRELSPQNRLEAVNTGGDTAARARQIDTQRTYDHTGTRLLKELGPLHQTQLVSGGVVDARQETTNTYDQGRPQDNETYNLVTTTSTSARKTDDTLADTRTTEYKYDGQSGLGWKLRQPTRTIVDPGGLALTTTALYDERTGQQIEHRQPSDPAGTTASTTRTALYTAGAHPTHAACAGKPGWAGMPCRTAPAAQPAGTPILIETTQYNPLLQPTQVVETTPAGSVLRTTTTTYDGAGRQTGEQITATTGTPVADQTTGYSTTTGRTTTTTAGGATITRSYDDLGRLSSYTDATGQATTYTYDIKDRLVAVADGKGTRTQSYDTADNLTTVTDTHIGGVISGVWDHDDQLVQQVHPNGVAESYAIDPAGQPASVTYTRTIDCASDCLVYSNAVNRSIHGQILTEAAFGARYSSYDQAGRLTQVNDHWGTDCTVRKYTHDANSNRTSLRTTPPAAGGACDTGGTGTLQTHTHDTADRLTDAGITHDQLGRITDLPATHAAGQSLEAGFYANDLARSVSQGTASHTYDLDPMRRFAARGTTGTLTHHYGDDSDNPTWTATNTTATTYTRAIAGLDGQLAALWDSDYGFAMVQYKNLHGDIAATSGPLVAHAPYYASWHEYDEFGNPRPENFANPRYGWLGSHERATDTPSGTSLMGVRLYQPTLGRFLQTDPIFGGSANPYDYANQDPRNQLDLDGRISIKKLFKVACRHPWCYAAGYAAGRVANGIRGGRARVNRRAVRRIDNSHILNRYFGKGGRLNSRNGFRFGVSRVPKHLAYDRKPTKSLSLRRGSKHWDLHPKRRGR